MKEPKTLFSISVKKYLHAILKCCCRWMLWAKSDKFCLSTPQTKDICDELFFNADYSMNEAFLEIESFCSEENFNEVHSTLCVCFQSMNYLPRSLAKIVWLEYVKRDFEIYFIQSFLTNELGYACIENLNNLFLSKFTPSPKILSVLQFTRNELLFMRECFEMQCRFWDYFENDSKDGPESDSDSEFDESTPLLVGYGNFPDTDSDEDFGHVVRQWSNTYVYLS